MRTNHSGTGREAAHSLPAGHRLAAERRPPASAFGHQCWARCGGPGPRGLPRGPIWSERVRVHVGGAARTCMAVCPAARSQLSVRRKRPGTSSESPRCIDERWLLQRGRWAMLSRRAQRPRATRRFNSSQDAVRLAAAHTAHSAQPTRSTAHPPAAPPVNSDSEMLTFSESRSVRRREHYSPRKVPAVSSQMQRGL